MRRCVSCLEMFSPWSQELSCYRCSPTAKRVSAPKPKPSNLILNDAGKSAVGMAREANDCTVRALAIACGVNYRDAYEFMRRNGRKPGKGAPFSLIIRRHNGLVLGHRLETALAIRPARGLKTFLERNPRLRTGTWILHSTHHASTLKEGKLYDSFDSTRKTFDGAWAVRKESE